jgi:hypothetical protein
MIVNITPESSKSYTAMNTADFTSAVLDSFIEIMDSYRDNINNMTSKSSGVDTQYLQDLIDKAAESKAFLSAAVDTIQEVHECCDMLYHETDHPGVKKLYPELSRYAGPISVINQITYDILKKINKKGVDF